MFSLKSILFLSINSTNLLNRWILYNRLLTSNIQMIQFWLEYNKMSDLKCMYIRIIQKEICKIFWEK